MLELVVDNKKDEEHDILFYWAEVLPGEATSTGMSTISYHVKRHGDIYLAGERLSPQKFIGYFYGGTLDHLALEIEDATEEGILKHINEVPPGYIKSVMGLKQITAVPRKLSYNEQVRLRKILKMQYPVSLG